MSSVREDRQRLAQRQEEQDASHEERSRALVRSHFEREATSAVRYAKSIVGDDVEVAVVGPCAISIDKWTLPYPDHLAAVHVRVDGWPPAVALRIAGTDCIFAHWWNRSWRCSDPIIVRRVGLLRRWKVVRHPGDLL